MKQTSKQEQDLLIQYEPYLRKIVFELRSRGGLPGVNDMEDLMQEARLEFLLHLRKIGDAEDIMNCKYNIKGALCTYWRLMAQLRIPKNSYHEEIRKVQCISMDDETCRCLADPTDRLSDEVEVRDFIDSLSP